MDRYGEYSSQEMQTIYNERDLYNNRLLTEKRRLWNLYIQEDTSIEVSSVNPVIFKEAPSGFESGMYKIRTDWRYELARDMEIIWVNHPDLDLMQDDDSRLRSIETEYKTELNKLYSDTKQKWYLSVLDRYSTEDDIKATQAYAHEHADRYRAMYTACGWDIPDMTEQCKAWKLQAASACNKHIKDAQTAWWDSKMSPFATPEAIQEAADYAHSEADLWRLHLKLIDAADLEDKSLSPENQAKKDFLEKANWNPKNLTIDQYNDVNSKAKRKDLYKYYKSFAGTDAVATLVFPEQKRIVLGQVSTLSYSIYRPKKIINTLGRISPRGTTKGPRTVAGSIIFTVTNTHWINDVIEELPDLFKNVGRIKADELPPFDIIINYANEYGASSYYVIYGAQIVEEGQVVSIEDAITENVCQFIAQDLDINTQNTFNNQGRNGTMMKDPDYNFLGKFKIQDLVSDDTLVNARAIATQNAQGINSSTPVYNNPPIAIKEQYGNIHNESVAISNNDKSYDGKFAIKIYMSDVHLTSGETYSIQKMYLSADASYFNPNGEGDKPSTVIPPVNTTTLHPLDIRKEVSIQWPTQDNPTRPITASEWLRDISVNDKGSRPYEMPEDFPYVDNCTKVFIYIKIELTYMIGNTLMVQVFMPAPFIVTQLGEEEFNNGTKEFTWEFSIAKSKMIYKGVWNNGNYS